MDLRGRRLFTLLIAAAAAVLMVARPGVAGGQSFFKSELPEEMKDVGIVQRRGAAVPPDLRFTDSSGRAVRIGDAFDGRRPVVLVMAYFRCPLLCPLILKNLQDCLNEMSWTVGDQFRVLVVSFDHTEPISAAAEKKAAYLAGYKAENVPEDAWSFWVSDAENARALARAVGFHYKYIPESGEFSHVSALIFLTPDGKVHNYLEQLKFPAQQVTLALNEAAEGKTASVFERIVFSCFKYDPMTGRYTASAFLVLRVTAIGTIVVLFGTIGVLVLTNAARHRAARAAKSGAKTASASPPAAISS
ncbi:MAG: SCO family protein [Phycisphaerales bacterium]|nr:SCO family protein [Phycisphaerales bacterium]